MRSSRYSSESGSSVIHACYEVHVYLTVTEGVGVHFVLCIRLGVIPAGDLFQRYPYPFTYYVSVCYLLYIRLVFAFYSCFNGCGSIEWGLYAWYI